MHRLGDPRSCYAVLHENSVCLYISSESRLPGKPQAVSMSAALCRLRHPHLVLVVIGVDDGGFLKNCSPPKRYDFLVSCYMNLLINLVWHWLFAAQRDANMDFNTFNRGKRRDFANNCVVF